MEEGVVARWVAADGDLVTKGQEIVEIDTDKTTMGFEAERSGRLKLLSEEGATVRVGEPIAAILDPADPTDAALEALLGGTETEDAHSDASHRTPESSTAARDEDHDPERTSNVSPVARRLARKLGVNLSEVAGTGPGGRVLKQDVRVMARPDATPLADVQIPRGSGSRPLDRIEILIADRMVRSHAEVPVFCVESEVDVTDLLNVRKEVGARFDVRPTLTDFLVKAVALSLRRHPRLNSSYQPNQITMSDEISVAIAVATTDSLVVPRLTGVEDASIGAIATRTRDLVERARSGTLIAAELEAASFTISNLGMFGITRFTAIVNQPQAAILTVGAARRTPVFDDHDQIVARDLMSIGLVSDHRLVYGAHAAAFMQTLRGMLEQPLSLLV
jgi:pyruvate dehydrogenase E2 component (dihydrolipoamide acetyltransferase)